MYICSHSADCTSFDRLPALAEELARQPVAVLAAVAGQQTPRAAQAATTSIPIVFGIGEDPVKEGLVPNLNRPGGNMTGATFFTALLGAKRRAGRSWAMTRTHDQAYNRDEDQKPAAPRMAQEPTGAKGSARSAKTRTDPASGEDRRAKPAPNRAQTDQIEGAPRRRS